MPLPRPLLIGAVAALTVVLSAAGGALAVSRHRDAAPTAALADVPTEPPVQVLPALPDAGGDEVVPSPADARGTGATTTDPLQAALEASWRAPAPRGSVAQISLRFMQALQRGDDLAAELQLSDRSRFVLSLRDVWTLHRVMTDVRKNAGLAGAGPCRRVRQLSKEAAVVTCGRRHVVVNAARPNTPNGVRIDDWTAHYDVFHGPHTHAYTLIVV